MVGWLEFMFDAEGELGSLLALFVCLLVGWLVNCCGLVVCWLVGLSVVWWVCWLFVSDFSHLFGYYSSSSVILSERE